MPIPAVGVAAAGVVVGVASGLLVASPTLVLAAAMSVLLLLLLPFFLAHPDRLLLVVVALMPLGAFGRGASDSGQAFNSIGQLAGGYLLVVWLAGLVARRDQLKLPPAIRWLGAFVGISVVASMAGINWGRSLFALQRYYIPYLVLIVVVYHLTPDRARLRRLCAAVVGSLTVVGAISILAGTGVVSLDVPGLITPVVRLGTNRVAAVSGGLGTASFQYTFGVALAIYLFHTVRVLWLRPILLGSIIILAIANLFTVTIFGITSMAVVIAACILLRPQRSRVREASGWGVPVKIAAVGLAAFGLLTFAYTQSDVFETRLNDRLAFDTPSYTWGGGRVGGWVSALSLVADHPVLGVGAYNVGFALPEYFAQFPSLLNVYYANGSFKDGELFIDSHNTFIAAFAEAGVVGGACFLIGMGGALLRLKQGVEDLDVRDIDMFMLGKCLLYGYSGGLVFALSTDILTEKYLWLGLAMVVACAEVVRRETAVGAGSSKEDTLAVAVPARPAAFAHHEGWIR